MLICFGLLHMISHILSPTPCTTPPPPWLHTNTHTPYTLSSRPFEFSCLRGGLWGNMKAKGASNTSLSHLSQDYAPLETEGKTESHPEGKRQKSRITWVVGGLPSSPQQGITVQGTWGGRTLDTRALDLGKGAHKDPQSLPAVRQSTFKELHGIGQ